MDKHILNAGIKATDDDNEARTEIKANDSDLVTRDVVGCVNKLLQTLDGMELENNSLNGEEISFTLKNPAHFDASDGTLEKANLVNVDANKNLMENMSNRNSRKGEWSTKGGYGSHIQHQAGFENVIGIVPLPFRLGMEGNSKVFGMVELVSNILSYLSTCDIKSCNGVSSLWHQEARKLLLKRTRMDFGGYGQNAQLQVDSYIEKMGDNCHQNMRIHSLKVNNVTKTINNQNAILKLGNKYGNRIQKLYFTMGNPDVLRSFTNVTVLTVSLDIPNFTKIPQDLIMRSVKTLSFNVKGRVFTLPEFAQSLLRMCPMLEYLELDVEAQSPFLCFFETFDLDSRGIPNQLSGLCFNGVDSSLRRPSRRLLNGFSAMRLTMLKIDFYGIVDNLGRIPVLQPAHALQEILAAFAPTLKHFKLYYIPDTVAVESVVKFPEMPKLETLEITHLYAPFYRFTFGGGEASDLGIDYKKQFPVLKKLSIKSALDAIGMGASLLLCEMFFPEGTLPCHTLIRLDVDCIANVLHGGNCKKEGYCFCYKEGRVWNMLKRLITMFPNVEKFKKCGGWQW